MRHNYRKQVLQKSKKLFVRNPMTPITGQAIEKSDSGEKIQVANLRQIFKLYKKKKKLQNLETEIRSNKTCSYKALSRPLSHGGFLIPSSSLTVLQHSSMMQ